MIVPTQRRQNGLDAELDALVAREVDALALRKARTPNGKPPRDQAAGERVVPEPATQHEDVRTDQAAARASRPAGSTTFRSRLTRRPSSSRRWHSCSVAPTLT